MNRWPTKPLASLGPITDGDWILKENYTSDGVRLIQVGDVGVGEFIGKSRRYISLERAKQLQCSFLKAGDILISRMPDPLGRACIFPESDCPAITAVDVAIFRPEPHKVRPRFIAHFLNSRRWFDEVIRHATGTTRPRISRTKLEQLEVPLPPIGEQERIVKLLDEADALRKLRAQAARRTAALIPALFHEMFGDPAINPHNFPIGQLGELTSIEAILVDPRDQAHQDLPHIGPDRVEGHSGRLLPSKSAREDGLISAKFLFDERDVLYSKIRPNLRKAALPNDRGLCSADMYPIRPGPRLSRDFLWAYLLTDHFTKRAMDLSARANIPKLNRDQLDSIEAPIPPLELQYEFAAHVNEVHDLQVQQAASRRRLDDLFNSMLYRAFAGEL